MIGQGRPVWRCKGLSPGTQPLLFCPAPQLFLLLALPLLITLPLRLLALALLLTYLPLRLVLLMSVMPAAMVSCRRRASPQRNANTGNKNDNRLDHVLGSNEKCWRGSQGKAQRPTEVTAEG